MPKAINNADAAQALTRAYSLKGKVSLALDEMVVPVTIVDNLAEEGSPIELRPCAGFASQAAVAAEFAYIGVQTQAPFKLSVSEFIMFNDSGNNLTVFLKTFTQANLTTIGISAGAMLALDLPEDSTTVGSQFWFGSHTAAVGSEFARFRIGSQSTTRIPVGATIHGVDNPNRVAVGIQIATLNFTLQCTARCVEQNRE